MHLKYRGSSVNLFSRAEPVPYIISTLYVSGVHLNFPLALKSRL
jgi:hypothetical protein